MKHVLTLFLWLLCPIAILCESFTNPVIWEDLADVDVIRVNDTFYYSASTMHYSPGAPILRSYDLVNWDYIGHSVPKLDFGDAYGLINGQRAYRQGVWASSLKYRASNKTWYWIGCIDFWTTYVYTAPSITGPWTKSSQLFTCYYDAGLLIDDDDTMYVSYGGTNLSVAQLSSDGLSEVRSQLVFAATGDMVNIEGSRFYKHNGSYYILTDHPSDAEYVLKSSSPWGPYTVGVLEQDIASPVPGTNVPHQGGIVDTPDGSWYYMAFVDNYPGGRTPVLAPMSWGSDGFPVLQTVNGGWNASYAYPLPKHTFAPLTGSDSFTGTFLGPQWEWNHNPNVTQFSVDNGLTLKTATVTNDLYQAQNTLTHRILGPTSTATIVMTINKMLTGDRAGLVMLRDQSAWVGVENNNGTLRVAMVSDLTMDPDTNWSTLTFGTEVAGSTLPSGTTKIWLRAAADIHPGDGKQVNFSYSVDGAKFNTIGTPFTMDSSWNFFMGYRYGIFNYATSQIGGSVQISSFTMTQP